MAAFRDFTPMPADSSSVPSHSSAGSFPQRPRRQAFDLLCMNDARDKATATRALYAAVLAAGGAVADYAQALGGTAAPALPARPLPGGPARPELVPPQRVERRRSLHTPAGRANLIHALCHIEFNAINLALDAVWRFDGMPQAFYADWLRVADEEALHFTLLADHLATLGFAYGDFPAHNSLWEMCDKTAGDVLARMALVPRTLEARGLDASPPVRARLAEAGDLAAAAILDIILRDEVGHVAIGNRWYRWLCAGRGLDPVATYAQLAERYGAPKPRGPFNLAARRAAGFDEDELAWLEGAAG
ncbi:ferritin-like domain-containing protein [Cupriavidus sp. Marseille-Q8015]